MAYIHSEIPFEIESIMNSLPHKLKNAKNVNIILGAWLRQLNKIAEVISKLKETVTIDELYGDMLDKGAANIGISRNIGESDEDLRFRVKLKIYSIKASGNVKDINTILSEVAGITDEMAILKEIGDAKIEVITNKGVTTPDILDKIAMVMNSAKPVGVEFVISSNTFTDFIMDVESIIETVSGEMYGYYAKDLTIATDNRFARDMEGNYMDFNTIDNIISIDFIRSILYVGEYMIAKEETIASDTFDDRRINRRYE